MPLGFPETRFATIPEFYVRPCLRTRPYLASFTLRLSLWAFSGFMVVQAWARLSGYPAGWIALAMLWAFLLFGIVWYSDACLRALRRTAQVDVNSTTSPSGDGLGTAMELSNRARILNAFSIFALLMAMTFRLPWH